MELRVKRLLMGLGLPSNQVTVEKLGTLLGMDLFSNDTLSIHCTNDDTTIIEEMEIKTLLELQERVKKAISISKAKDELRGQVFNLRQLGMNDDEIISFISTAK